MYSFWKRNKKLTGFTNIFLQLFELKMLTKFKKKKTRKTLNYFAVKY